MLSVADCLLKANEAEQLMRMVSYHVDKERLQKEAAEWRRRAQATPSEIERSFSR